MFLRSGKNTGGNSNQNTNTNSEKSNQNTLDTSLNQTFSSTFSDTDQFNLALDTTMVDNPGTSQGNNSDNEVVTIKMLTPILQAERKYLDTRLQSIESKLQQFFDYATQNQMPKVEPQLPSSSKLSNDIIQEDANEVINYNDSNNRFSNKITVKSQPLFFGKEKEEVEQWFRITERNLQASFVSERYKILAASAFLRDDAEKAFDHMLKVDPNLSWDNFKTRLTKRFCRGDSKQSMIQKLSTLKQSGDIETYTREFMHISNHRYIQKFFSNIKSKIERKIIYSNFNFFFLF